MRLAQNKCNATKRAQVYPEELTQKTMRVRAETRIYSLAKPFLALAYASNASAQVPNPRTVAMRTSGKGLAPQAIQYLPGRQEIVE